MMKQEKGSITLFVLVACLFFVLMLVGAYTFTLNKIQTQTLSIPAPIDYLWQKIWYDDLTSPHE